MRTLGFITFLLAVAISAVSYTATACADTLPAAQGLYEFYLPDVNQNNTGFTGNYAFGFQSQQVTTNVGGTVYVSASEAFSAANGNFSSVSDTVSTAGLFTKNFQAVSTSAVSYYIEIAGPAGAQVPLNVTAAGSVYTAHPTYLVDSRFQVCDGICYNLPSGNPPTQTVLLADACVTYGLVVGSAYQNCGGGRSASFSLSRQYSFYTNTLYNVVIDSNVDVTPYTNLSGTPGLGSGTQLDPSFSLDSTYAATGLYTLETSDSALPIDTATPEPSTVILTFTGILVAGIFRRNVAGKQLVKTLPADGESEYARCH